MNHQDEEQNTAPGSTPDSGNVLEIFARASHRAGDASSAGPTDQDGLTDQKKKQPYKATLPAKSKREIRLKICYPHQRVSKSRRPPYSHLNDIIETGHQWLSLVYTNMVVVLKGRHLDKLGDDLHDEAVRAIICFQPDIHEEPEEGEPVILEIHDKTIADFEFLQTDEVAA